MPEFICPHFTSLSVDWGIQKPRLNCGVCLKWDLTRNKCSIEAIILNDSKSSEVINYDTEKEDSE